VRGPDSTVGPMLGDIIGVDCFYGWHLRARFCSCIIECIASAATSIFLLQNYVVLKLEPKL
jgi:hypothetical protein